jgi:type I site-specific restriction endonuclease
LAFQLFIETFNQVSGLKTSLNRLKEVRFYGRNYINADFEKVIRVQSQNELIADVILEHFCGQGLDSMPGIVFCTSTSHADEMVHIMNSNGISTLDAHSRVDNDAIQKFR